MGYVAKLDIMTKTFGDYVRSFAGWADAAVATGTTILAFAFNGCASHQAIVMPHQNQQILEQPAPRKYNFETSDTYIRDNLSYTESTNGKSKSVDIEMFDTDEDGKTVEQAIVTKREGFESKKVMFVRNGAKVAEQPNSGEDVRTMSPEDEGLFDRMYGGRR